MQKKYIVFIDLFRLKQISSAAFEWVIHSLNIQTAEYFNDELLQEFADTLSVDIIVCGKTFVYREDSGVIDFWSEDDTLWTRRDNELLELIAEQPFNPLRVNQPGYVGLNASKNIELKEVV